MNSILKTLGGCILIIFTFSIMEAIGMQVIKPNVHENHVHRFSDARLQFVKILSIENNSITVEDLEEHAVGLDLRYEISDIFYAADATNSTMKHLKVSDLKNRTGILTYCEVCHKALAFAIKEVN